MNPELLIRKCAEKVYNTLKYGLAESAYRNALICELQVCFKKVETEYNLPLDYTNANGHKKQICCLRVDILVDDVIPVELKTITTIQKKHKNQLRRYLECLHQKYTMFNPTGFLINFSPTSVSVTKLSRI